jgi:hypothetical protein
MKIFRNRELAKWIGAALKEHLPFAGITLFRFYGYFLSLALPSTPGKTSFLSSKGKIKSKN